MWLTLAIGLLLAETDWTAAGVLCSILAVVLGTIVTFQQVQINSLKKAVAECERERKKDSATNFKLSQQAVKEMHLRIAAEQTVASLRSTVNSQRSELKIYRLKEGREESTGETETHEDLDS